MLLEEGQAAPRHMHAVPPLDDPGCALLAQPDLGGETIETVTIDFIEAHLLGTQPLYEVKRLTPN